MGLLPELLLAKKAQVANNDSSIVSPGRGKLKFSAGSLARSRSVASFVNELFPGWWFVALGDYWFGKGFRMRL